MKTENAIEILKSLDSTTVIDANWLDYINGTRILTALLEISQLKNYSNVMQVFEGYTIGEFLNFHI